MPTRFLKISSNALLHDNFQFFISIFYSADTSVFFHCTDTAQEEAEAGEQDEVFSRILSRLSAKLKWKTKKKLTFKRVFLKPIEK